MDRGQEESEDIIYSDDEDGDINLSSFCRGMRKRSYQTLEDSESDEEIIQSTSKERSTTSKGRSTAANPRRIFERPGNPCQLQLQSNKENVDDSGHQALMSEVQKSNKLLLCLVNRVKKTEKRLKEVEDHLKNSPNSSSSSGSTPTRRKRDVPGEVRVSGESLCDASCQVPCDQNIKFLHASMQSRTSANPL